MFRRVYFLFASTLFISVLAQAEITGLFTFPDGSDGAVQISSGGVFVSSNTFNFRWSSGTLQVPKIQFGDGTVQDTAGGGGGGSGDITSVTAGTGLSGGGLTGAVTLSLNPSATNFVQVDPISPPQTGALNISSGTFSGPLTAMGQFTAADPTGSSLTFSPTSSDPVLRLKTNSLTTTDFGIYFRDSFGNDYMAERFVPASNGTYGLFISSYSGGSLTNRIEITRDTGIIKFKDRLGTKFVEFDPVRNSSFTIPIYASSGTIQNCNVITLKFNDGTTMTTAATGGGGAAALEVFNNFDGTKSSPTASIGMSDAFRGSVSGSTYTFSANSSSVTLLGPSIALGSETTGIYTASVTAPSPFILSGTNNAAGGAPIFGLDTSSVTLLGPSIDVSGAEATGTLAAGRFPALTGDVTTSAGSLTTTVVDDSHNHTVATSTFAVTGGTFTVTGGTTTIGGVTYKWPQAQASGTKILSNDGTGQLSWATDATSAGGGDNFGSHVATRQVDMAGFPILNVSSIGVTGSGPSIIDVGTNTAISFVVNGSTWDLNASSLTYRGTAALIGTNIAVSSISLPAFFSDNSVRSNLGLAIGSNVQAYDADLDDLADGSLSGSKVGSGVPAANIASGSLGSSVIASSIAATTNITGLSGLLADAQKVKFSTGGTQVAISSSVNFIEGTNVTLGTTVDGNNRVNVTINSTGGGGGASALEVFSNFDGTKSSPTASIALGDSLNLSVSGSTVTLDVDLSSITAAVGTFTNKTFDAQGTGNVMAFLDTWQWNNADSLFAGTTYYTTTSSNPMYGHGTFAGSNSTSTCGVYIIGNAGADFDTTTDLTMLLYDFTGDVDTSSRTYIVSVATYTTGMNLSTMTYGSPITVTISNFSVGGINRRGVSASTTLTAWKSVLSANADFAVAVRRQGDSATLDLSTIDSYFGGAIITRGRRQ